MYEDKEAIEAVLDIYFKMVNEADHTQIPSIFHDPAHLYTLDNGNLVDLPWRTYQSNIEKRVAPRERGCAHNGRILMMDFAAPNMATVKAEVNVVDATFTDYFIFLKINNVWKVIAKSFDSRPFSG